jgi:hypothetical protein
MRRLPLFLAAALAVSVAGCERRVPAPKPPPPKYVKLQSVRELGTPSALIDPPPEPSASDKMPFDLPLNQGYGIEGSWTGPTWDHPLQAFNREGSFKVKKSDDSTVDPKEIDALLQKWIAASGVQTTDTRAVGTIGEDIIYGTPKTVGTVQLRVFSDSPAKVVSFSLRIWEKPRQPR